MMVFVSELAKSLCFERDPSAQIGYALLKIAVRDGVAPGIIGERAGMSSRAVCELLLGKREFTLSTTSNIAVALGGRIRFDLLPNARISD